MIIESVLDWLLAAETEALIINVRQISLASRLTWCYDDTLINITTEKAATVGEYRRTYQLEDTLIKDM
jgi:hypothetical protein